MKWTLLSLRIAVKVLGEQGDNVGGMGVGVVRMKNLYKDNGVKNVTLRLYEDDRHEILNETDRDKVYADIAKWIENLI